MLNWQITYWSKSNLINKEMIELFTLAANNTAKVLKIKDDLYFDVVIVNDKQMQNINHKFRKINRPTDVISFALNDAKTINTPLIGEIYLGPKYISQYNNDHHLGFKYECLITFIHGILHLLGYDHMNKKQEKIMFDLQKKICDMSYKGNK